MIDPQLLERLNDCARSTNEPIEGSVFYWNTDREMTAPAREFALKRQRLADIAQQHTHMLEIGFNAGHSAALMLTANPDLHLRAIDIGLHRYTELCADIIKQHFGSRFEFVKKSSAQLTKQDCAMITVVHCDGDHSTVGASRDLALIARHCEPGTVVILDDWELPTVVQAMNMHRSSYAYHPDINNYIDQSVWVLR